MQKIYFVTGTDTGVGKTTVTLALMKALQEKEFSAIGLKPIASGAQLKEAEFKNEDALALQTASSVALRYNTVNPVCFEAPIAPHLAAQIESKPLNFSKLVAFQQTLKTLSSDFIFIEGAGGWDVPIDSEQQQTFGDWVKTNAWPVILVVGLRVGCFNHALLTQRAFKQQNISVVGWIANTIDDALIYENELLASLKEWLKIPFLGHLRWKGTKKMQDRFFLDALINN